MKKHIILLLLLALQMFNLEGHAHEFRNFEYRAADEIQARLNPKSKPNIILVWTEKEQYALNDIVKIVVESNNDKLYLLKINMAQYKNILEPLSTEFKTIIENGKTNIYNIYYFKAIGSGSVVIEPNMMSVVHKKQKANAIQFVIY
jgi:hypothetical protein